MKTRNKIIAITIVVSIAISLIIVAVKTDAFRHEPEYTLNTGGVSTSDGVYFFENRNDTGFVYRIDTEGKVTGLTSSRNQGEERAEAVDFEDGTVHMLYSSGRFMDDEYRTVYRIVTYSRDLKARKDSYPFFPQGGGVLASFVIDAGRYYLTFISPDGSDLNVYEVLTDDLIEIGNGESGATQDVETLESILGRTSPDGSFFADAYYSSAGLIIRTPADYPDGVFAKDVRVADAVNHMKLSFLKYMMIYRTVWALWMMGLLLWFIALYILYRVMRNRDRMFYEIVLMETLLFAVMLGCFTFAGEEYARAGEREYTRYAEMALTQEMEDLGDVETVDFNIEDYFKSDTYRRIQESLSDFARAAGNAAVFKDVFLMRIKDRTVVTGIRGLNREDAAFLYGSSMVELAESFSAATPRVIVETELEGRENYAVGVADGGYGMRYALVGIIEGGDPLTGFWSNIWFRLLVFSLAYLVISALMFMVVYWRARDLKSFEYAISEAALGRTEMKIPYSEARDLRSMWKSLSELVKRIDEINYSRFRIFEAYYRFAPKNIETAMGKDSITEVKNGDVTATEGTLMLITSGRSGYDEKQIHALNNIISYLEEFANRKEGILVSEDSSLSMLQFLFLKESTGIISHAVQFLHRNAPDADMEGLSVFLYYAPFMYGIAGAKTQSLTYLAFEYAGELEQYARWFRRMKLSLVITEEIKQREEPGEIRHIGYIKLSGGRKKVMLYEVLDACPARERQMKLINKEKFEATLELFYQKDFYLARNQFSELLREMPEDEIAKWYLFESEKYLNDVRVQGDFGQLRLES